MATCNHPCLDFRNFQVDAWGTQSWELWATHDGTGLDASVNWPDNLIAVILDSSLNLPGGWAVSNLDEERRLRVTATPLAPQAWGRLCRIAFQVSKTRVGPEALASLVQQLESIGLACTVADDCIIARSGRNFEGKESEDGKSVEPLEFVLWYDGRSYYRERGELLLHVRIIVGNVTRCRGLSQEIKQELALTINSAGNFGRFNAGGLFLEVQWDCFVVGDLDLAALQVAMFHLGRTARMADMYIEQAERKMARVKRDRPSAPHP